MSDICSVSQVISNEGVFCNKIKESCYVQSIEDKHAAPTFHSVSHSNIRYRCLLDIIIGLNDSMYKIIPHNEMPDYLRKQKSKIASFLEEHKLDYDKFNFNKKIMKSSIIQSGFQETKRNYVSSLYFLNEYYKKHHILVDDIKKINYHSSNKDYESIYIYKSGNEWFMKDSCVDGYEQKSILEHPDIINDISCKDNMMIYNLYLESLSKYKLNGLQVIAQELKIPIMKGNGKSKLKGDLYREINLMKLVN